MDSTADSLMEGLYETLITERFAEQLARTESFDREVGEIDPSEQPEVLARHVRGALTRALRQRSTPERLALINTLLTEIGEEGERLVEAKWLLSLLHPSAPGHVARSNVRPLTPFSEANLLTNAPQDARVGEELAREIRSADRIDLIMAFVKWYGLRVFDDELSEARRRGVPIRVITTTYMGATEQEAVNRLVREFGAQVRIQYDDQRTRLHAKAWLFLRNSGFHTAYVGSSNLSRSAMLDGLEWNVRLSEVATPVLVEKFRATFESYWEDSAFVPYDPDKPEDVQRLRTALQVVSTGAPKETIMLSGLEVQPREFQSEMLEAIERARSEGHHRNLVVAATGTGKTVLAAIDYRNLCKGQPSRPRLLFVAHREEILKQSLRTYREVLADGTFGELYVSGERPDAWDYVFASIQSLTSYGPERLAKDHFDIVVVDEFHHAAASTYRRLLEHLTPKELLGLTATPERADGTDVREFFDGRTAAELRVWKAIDDQLLCPFHYFAVSDNTDLSALTWKRGTYDQGALDRVLTGNDARAALVVKAVRDKIADIDTMKALGFCVSIAHAQYMADAFNKVGIPALAVTSGPDSADRAMALLQLRAGDIKAIFTVDMFNEGVDVPSVNTVLFLRPTESATVFLQQLGRGLRLSEDKPVLTAIDFVGHQHENFRFDQRFTALTGQTRSAVEKGVREGFSFLPSGCRIIFDEVAQREVLANLKQQLAMRWNGLVSLLRSHPVNSLETYLDDNGLELADVLKNDRSWSRLRREAGLSGLPIGPDETALSKRVRAFAHVDDPERATAYTRLLQGTATYEELDDAQKMFARMLVFSLWPDGGGLVSFGEGLHRVRANAGVCEDISEVIRLAQSRADHVTRQLSEPHSGLPLRLHARYTREEILTALRHVSLDGTKPSSFREGVLFSTSANADAFFITVDKSEGDYSPTTMYRDYAISPRLFHWESQSRTRVSSPTGQRYLHHEERGSSVFLFVRESRTSPLGKGAPYTFLGPARYVSHEGDQPIAITWELATPMPASVFRPTAVIA